MNSGVLKPQQMLKKGLEVSNLMIQRSVSITEKFGKSFDKFLYIPSPLVDIDAPVAKQRRYPQQENRLPQLRYQN